MNIVDTERIRLRPLEAKDVSRLVEALNDWDTAQWLPTVPFPYRREDAESFITDNASMNPPQAYAIASRRSDELIGVIGLVRSGTTAELGYWLVPRHRGLGLASEAIQHLIAAQDASLASIFATVDRGNIPSMKLLERVGFRLTGEHARETPNRRGNIVVLRYERDMR
ncbi:GNAT family N-acetyltransferase [Pleomorphomonas sp. NRK KF1]|uniref:GNAT family N-acetyltransferase n=1 Tax=Pleomorphomonas sp. NRK KF1 TaxID=2943000 RepID=UPI002043EADB|nr:GNAT family N-acetyltransferase [Pleomorphomonas sp. NRK KF1]MCM5554849.1 GNAT family N-acetyltransferase [Pleomorphomonas sp. NRK KF1]